MSIMLITTERFEIALRLALAAQDLRYHYDTILRVNLSPWEKNLSMKILVKFKAKTRGFSFTWLRNIDLHFQLSSSMIHVTLWINFVAYHSNNFIKS